MFLVVSVLLFFSTSFQLSAVSNDNTENTREVIVKKTSIIVKFQTFFEWYKSELILCAAHCGCPVDIVPILCNYCLGMSFNRVKTISADEQEDFLTWLANSAIEGKIDTVKTLIAFNSFLVPEKKQLRRRFGWDIPCHQCDAKLICDFYNFVNKKQNKVTCVADINSALCGRYPYAVYDGYYRVSDILKGDIWNDEKITKFLRAGFIIPIYLDTGSLRDNSIRIKPILHYLLRPIYTSKQGTSIDNGCVYVKPDYELLKSVFESGANPNYKKAWEGDKDYHNKISPIPDAFDVIKLSGHPDEEREKLTLLAQEYIHDPVNTTDLFYPETRGYRKDLDRIFEFTYISYLFSIKQ